MSVYDWLSGRNLQDVLRGLDERIEAIRARQYEYPFLLCLLLRGNAQGLVGQARGWKGPDTELTEATVRQRLSGPEYLMARTFLHAAGAIDAFFDGHFRHAFSEALEAETHWANHGHVLGTEAVLFGSLAAAALCRECPETSHDARSTLARWCQRLRLWADQCAENYGAKADLLEAEAAALDGDVSKAARLYEKAVGSASHNGLIHIAALACERAGEHALHTGAPIAADAYFAEAIHFYERWGASARVAALRKRHGSFARTPAHKGTEAILSENTSSTNPQGLDFESLLKASQTLAAEIEPARVLEKLMQVLIENAGATRGYFIDTGGAVPRVLARGSGNTVEVGPPMPLSECPDVPVGVFEYSVRTGRSVVVADAAAEGLFQREPTVQRLGLKSILSIPVVRHGLLVGVLYLENHLVSGAFSDSRMAAVQMLTGQIAVSLENAEYFRRLQDQSRELQAKNTELARQIQERLLAEEVLSASEQKYRSLFDNLGDGAFLVDLDSGHVIDANRQACVLVGRSRSELVNQPFARVYPEGVDPLLAPLLADRPSLVLTEIARSDGGSVSAHIASTLLEHQDRRLLLSVFADVTAQKRAEAEILRAKQLAEDASEAKGNFLANMSHELRTPLNAIIGFASLLAMTELTEEQRESVSVISDNGENLLTLINDVLEFSRMEAGALHLRPNETDLRDLLESCVLQHASTVGDKGIDLVYTMDPNAPPRIVVDGARLRQVLANLLTNAVKFTPSGLISLAVRSERRPDGSWHLTFTVTDSGIGIPEDKLPNLFQPFSQIDASQTRRFGGVGLGLVISRRVAQAMGGSVTLRRANRHFRLYRL